ncbi:MAG: helix-turn-helix domain-containing protein [Roseburia sp.]|nr:helix-turn-helix domain-containing protein [Roseburia sp.]
MNTRVNSMVGKRLRKIRNMLDISSEEMAETLELSLGHFHKLERGEHGLSIVRLKMLREIYGIDLNYLITGRSKEEDIARDLIYGTPEETFYFLHQLLDSCERTYLMRAGNEGDGNDKKHC